MHCKQIQQVAIILLLGKGPASNLTTGSNNIYIGTNNVGFSATQSNIIVIGNTFGPISMQHVANYQAGIYNRGPVFGPVVHVDSFFTGQLGTIAPSSRKYKDNIVDMADESSPILKLRPVTFSYKSDAAKTKQFGLIAEEVHDVFPALVVRGADGQIEAVKYHELASLLLNELIKQHAIIEKQQVAIEKQRVLWSKNKRS